MGCNDKMCDMNMDCMHCDKANCTLRKYDYDKMEKMWILWSVYG